MNKIDNPLTTDYNQQQGGASIGARLRRLSERIDRDANRVYASLGLEFEQRWMGTLNQLHLNGNMSVNEVAAALGISHPSVSQTRRSLLDVGLIAEHPDPDDGRRRTLALTAAGKSLVTRLLPVWAALDVAALALNAEAGDLVSGLTRLDRALNQQSLFERVSAALAAAPTRRGLS
ncbi:MarR family winged helix-turn-helix transcriptional regulator [Duganella sp. Dugasp56]|uniref:MarR family winged helix-turn-helix transcriptional regulator n=1 Tax=Duganella sp. Dugasp56 TaxID=3243046 RepID=UPI0039AFBA9A